MWSCELELGEGHVRTRSLLELGEGHARTRSLLENVEFGAWLFPFFEPAFKGIKVLWFMRCFGVSGLGLEFSGVWIRRVGA